MSFDFPNNNELKGSQRREKYIKNKYPEFYNHLINNYPNNISFREKLYWYYNDIHTYPICKECGKLLKFHDGKIGYGKFCSSKCSANNNDIINNRNNIRKAKQDIINKKIINTIIEKYGSMEEFNKIRLDKTKQTNLEKYGVEFPLQDKNIRHQAMNTILEKYGNKCSLCNKDILNKTKQTNLEKYGVEHYTNREKSKATRKLNYKLKHNDIIDIINDNDCIYYICKCINSNCDKCSEKNI